MKNKIEYNLKITWIDPRKLIQSEENNKDHRDNLDAIIESLELFGWQFPLLIANDMKIISGHGRVQAAIKLKMKEVPVIISNMSTEMADEFRIVDNVTQAAGKIDMVKVTSILKNMNPKSKHLEHIKSIVNDIYKIRHWMEDYFDPKNPNRNKKIDQAFEKAREYQIYTSSSPGGEGIKVTGNKPKSYREDNSNDLTLNSDKV